MVLWKKQLFSMDEIRPHVVTAFLYSQVQRTFNTLASVTERYQCTDGLGH